MCFVAESESHVQFVPGARADLVHLKSLEPPGLHFVWAPSQQQRPPQQQPAGTKAKIEGVWELRKLKENGICCVPLAQQETWCQFPSPPVCYVHLSLRSWRERPAAVHGFLKSLKVFRLKFQHWKATLKASVKWNWGLPDAVLTLHAYGTAVLIDDSAQMRTPSL